LGSSRAKATKQPAKAEFIIAGRGSTEAARKFATVGNLKAAGWVEDISELIAASDVVIVPIESGGGTRFKILEALAAGVPVLSTPKGAEGLDLVDGRDIFLAEAGRFDAALRGRGKVVAQYPLPAFKERVHTSVESLLRNASHQARRPT